MTWTTQDAPWWTRAVVYQVYPRSFADSDGDGIGDLRGILGRLDHLAELGVDVVWLSPIYASPQDDNGYDISDYQAVDPVFGTLEDLDELVAALHERGMKLVMDLVVNHTSDEHPWFVESRDPSSPKRDWYWWRPPRDGMAAGAPGAEPTNWGSFFGGLGLGARRGLRRVLPAPVQPQAAGPELGEPAGPRGGLRDDALVAGPRGRRLPDGRHQPHLQGHRRCPTGVVTGGLLADGSASYVCGPRIHEFLAEMHQAVFAGRPERLLTVGEMPGVTVEQARDFTDPARAEVDMVFQFEHVGLDHGPGGKFDVRPLRLLDLKASFGRWQAGLADVGWNSLYWDNHDQPRIVSRFGDDGAFRRESATMLATVLHLHRGTPYVYQGEELGMTNAHFTRFDQYRDIETLNHVAVARSVGTGSDEDLLAGIAAMGRDNARTPMQWDGSPHAGLHDGHPVDRGERELPDDQRRGGARRPRLGLPLLPAR